MFDFRIYTYKEIFGIINFELENFYKELIKRKLLL